MEWANDSLELALRYAYRDVDGSEVVNGTILSEAYYQRALPIVREQLAIAAAVRLAYTLDHMLWLHLFFLQWTLTLRVLLQCARFLLAWILHGWA
jgi:hypothetical protein